MKSVAIITAVLGFASVPLSGCAMDTGEGVQTKMQESNARGRPPSTNDTAVADDVETTAATSDTSCFTNSGINPMKAALAVAMATEIGRLDAVADLQIVNGAVALKDTTKSTCSSRGFGACPNTDAILSMQQNSVNNSICQTVFNATTFREDLKASFDRQSSHENDLKQNNPGALPGAHELWQVGMTSNAGACGVHYDFAATGTKLNNLAARLVFFGGTDNPFIAFMSSNTTISIDPTGTMNGTTSTSSLTCTSGCYAYTTSLIGACCSCNGNQGTFRRATWNPSMVYCAY